MAHQVFMDRIDTLACTEVKGVITSMTRVARIRGLESIDYEVLQEALDDAGVPKYGDKLTSSLDTVGEVGAFDALILIDRSIKMVGDDPHYSDVTLLYKHALEEEASQRLDNPFSIGNIATGVGSGIIYGRTRCTVQQRPQNFYYKTQLEDNPDDPEGDQIPVKTKTLITVSHDFTKDSVGSSEFAGRVNTQGGVIQVQQPMKVFDFSGVINTPVPWLLANTLIASINEEIWQGEDEYTWMCTEVHWQIMSTGIYKFYFQFTHNPDTWLYTPIWTDPRTNRPHPKAVSGVDYFDIHWHEELDYNSVFGAFFEVWEPDLV